MIVGEPAVLNVMVSALSSPTIFDVPAGSESCMLPLSCDPVCVQVNVKVPEDAPLYLPDHVPDSGPAGRGFTLGCAVAVGGPSARADEDADGVVVVELHAASSAAATHPKSPNLIQDIVVLRCCAASCGGGREFSVEQEPGF